MLRPIPLAATAVLLAGLVLNSWFDYRRVEDLASDNALVRRSQAALEVIAEIDLMVIDAESAQRGFLLTGERRYLAPYDAARQEVRLRIDQLRDLVADNPHQLEHIEPLRRVVDSKFDELEAVILAQEELGPEVARQMVMTHLGRQAMLAVRGELDRLEANELRMLAERDDRSRVRLASSAVSELWGTIAVVALVAIGYGVIAWGFLRRRTVELEIESQRELLTVILRSIGDGVLAADVDGRVTFINEVASGLTGWSADDALGHPVEEVLCLVDETTGEAVETPLAEVLRGGEPVRLRRQVALIARDGCLRSIDDSAAPVRRRHGALSGAVIVFRDVTEERSAAQELRRVAEQLERTNRRKTEFLAMLSHELRNPLAPIRTAIEIVKRSADPLPALTQALPVLERQVELLVRLVDDLLDISRVNRGKLNLRRERVSLGEALERALEVARPMCEERGLELIVESPPEDMILDADMGRLAQLFGNLLNNACKYTDFGGHVTLHAFREDDCAVIEVGDSGVGLAPEELETIFEMFAQVDSTLARSQGGLGIGLTLVRSLVEMHGGSVAARSDGPGRGSVFVVRLPLASETSTTVPRAGALPLVEPAQLARLRILVVDDNRDAARGLGTILELEGCDVAIAHDGAAALEAYAEQRPDAVLLDLSLPGQTGFEVLEALRAHPGGQSLVAVAVTGHGQPSDRERTALAGFDAHLVKPVDYREVLRVTTRAVEARRGS